MTYDTEKKNAAARAFMKYMPGLTWHVARAWVTAEQGGYNNIFGVTNGEGKLYRYRTLDAGAKAAANVIHTNPIYAPIVRSLKKSEREQAMAIVKSPWRLGVSGLKKVGGTDPYYRKIFTEQGAL